MLLKPGATWALAADLQAGRLTLGEAFTFLSGLYFRGKITYAQTFGRAAAPHATATFIITPTRGLMAPDTIVTAQLLHEFASVDVAADDDRYRVPLERDLRQLAKQVPAGVRIVLLGSIASDKYVTLLVRALGSRLHYPPSFIGRGDMSRGGLLLRSARAQAELDYSVLEPGAVRRGRRPPKLEPLVNTRPAARRLRLERVL
jgi:hypothetical protein